MLFYKACFEEDLSDRYIPGTVTKDIQEAITWLRRYSSKKKGQYSIKRNGRPVLIAIDFDTASLRSHEEFQKSGVCEHGRVSCWTSAAKTKAQINIPVGFKLLKEDELLNLQV